LFIFILLSLPICFQVCHNYRLPKINGEDRQSVFPGVPREGHAHQEEKIRPPWRAALVVENGCLVAGAAPLVDTVRLNFRVVFSGFIQHFFISFPNCCLGTQRLAQCRQLRWKHLFPAA